MRDSPSERVGLDDWPSWEGVGVSVGLWPPSAGTPSEDGARPHEHRHSCLAFKVQPIRSEFVDRENTAEESKLLRST